MATSKIKKRGLYKKLNAIKTYDELIEFIANLKSVKGFSIKHLNYLLETKEFIQDFVNDGFTLLDIKYALVHKINLVHIFCPICKQIEIHSTGYSYPKTCGSKHCSYKQMEITLQKTCLEKYGVTSVLKLESTIQKSKQTRLDKYGTLSPMPYLSATLMDTYGVSNVFDIPGVREKSTQTMLERYGYDCPLSSPKIHEQARQTKLEKYGDENYNNNEKSKQTKLEKYGDANYNNVKKAKETFVKHYGVDNNMKSAEGIKAYSNIIKQKYGTDYFVETDEFKEKSQQTSLRKYGTRSPMQNKDIIDKCRQKYTYDGQNFDSSWELAFWIYCKDNSIEIERPNISFDYVDIDGNHHNYFPDFKTKNGLIEIKGDDQFDENGKMIDKLDHSKDYIAEAKHQCMLKNNVKILKGKEIKFYLDYIDQKYGKHYLKQFKNNTKKI